MSLWTISQHAYCQDAITSGSLQYAHNYMFCSDSICAPWSRFSLGRLFKPPRLIPAWQDECGRTFCILLRYFSAECKGKYLLLLRRANCGLFKSCLSAGHTPSIAFRHLPPNSAGFGDTTQGAIFISAQLSTDAVSALRKVWVLIWLWKQLSAPAPT